MKLQIVFMGRSYDAAQQLPSQIDVKDGATLDDALACLIALPEAQKSLSGSCLVSVTGRHVGTIAEHVSVDLRDGDELVLIAPIAGG